jgi:hypothetical protein
MIEVNPDDKTYRRLTWNKWKQTLPSINEEQALKCEALFVDYVNNKITEATFLSDVNGYLKKEGLIK